MTAVEDQFQRNSFLFFGILSLLFSLVTVFGNSFLLYTLYRDPLKCFRTPAAYSIASLAVADLSNGTFVHTSHAVYSFLYYSGWDYPLLYEAFYFAVYVCMLPSIFLMVVISIERLIAVRWPHKYKHIAKPRVVILINVLFWLYGLFFAGMPYINIASFEMQYLVDLILNNFSPLVISITLYSIVFFTVKKRIKRTLGSMTHTAQRKRRALELEKSTAKACLIVVICFFVSYFPYLILVLLEIYCMSCEGTKMYFFFRNLANAIMFLNPSSNPFIYAWKISTYRRSFLFLIKKATTNRVDVTLCHSHRSHMRELSVPQSSRDTVN